MKYSSAAPRAAGDSKTKPEWHVYLTYVVPCLVYSFFSMSMVYSNKMVLSVYAFHFHFSLLFLQNLAAVILVVVAKKVGIVNYADFDYKTAKKWLPVNLFFVSMLLTGSYSLRFLSVPMMTVFKNLTNIPISFGDKILYGQTVSSGVVFSMALMIASAVIGGWQDTEFSVLGYSWMLLNCISTAGYVLYLRTAMKTTNLGEFGMMFYNNLLSLPLVMVMCVIFSEVPSVIYSPLFLRPGFIIMITFSGVVGFGLSLSSFWCVKKTSPTTFSLTGSLNKIPLAFLGMFLFDTPVTFAGVVSILIGMAGGVMYSYTKQKHVAKSIKKLASVVDQDVESAVVKSSVVDVSLERREVTSGQHPHSATNGDVEKVNGVLHSEPSKSRHT